MRSKLLFSVASILCVGTLLLHANPATATFATGNKLKPTGAKFAVDLGRSLMGIVEGIITLTSDGEAKAELIAVQEGTNANADGTVDDSTNAVTAATTTTNTNSVTATGSAAPTAFTNGVYDYVRSAILMQADLSTYSVLQQNLNSPKGEGNARTTCESLNFTSDRAKQTCIAIVDTFFADKGDEGNTEEYKAQILSQRNAYGKQIAERHVTLGYNVQQSVITDLTSVAQAPVSSDNEIGEIAIDGQTLDEMIKITVADLALQIEMMEADAIDFLGQQPVEIMPSEKPAEEVTE